MDGGDHRQMVKPYLSANKMGQAFKRTITNGLAQCALVFIIKQQVN
jgi:hypothetical protein